MKINFQNLTNSQFFRNCKISGDFFRNCIFQKYFFSDGFFSTIFFSLRIFWGCSFDAEIGPLSIYEVFRAIPALLHLVWSKFQDLGSERGKDSWPGRNGLTTQSFGRVSTNCLELVHET